MPLYDYRCDGGHVTESRQGVEVESIPCSHRAEPGVACGSSARRAQVNAPIIDLDMAPRSGAIRRQRQEHRDYAEALALVGTDYDGRERNGDPVRKRDFLGEAKARARKKGAAGARGGTNIGG